MKKVIAAILCIVMCICTVSVPITADSVTVRDVSVQENYASLLKSLGLFRGVSETNFDLKRAPTRVEALVMLIRVLGEENAALDGDWEHPFTDVAKWADPYVGYAYETGLTKGISATEFGNGDSTAAMYLTFMLRALGYSDVNNEDFSWDDPYSLARTTGILTDEVNIEVFWRADAVTVSFAALPAYLKNSNKTLADKLIDAGVFTKDQYEAAMYSTTPAPKPDEGTTLTAMQISEKCAPAVFYVEIYAYNGKLVGSGSGFFISADGYAITNYHVAANSLSLVITTESGKKYEDVSIVDASKENDLALLKVNSNDTFPYLEFGNSDAIKQGQTVYAIGSPRGLDNTLSQGIISNVNRPIDGTPFFQISVPVDHGSSGGALIDEYGKVIAVTTASITDNTADLNLAVPIKYAAELDRTKTKNISIWSDIFYPDFDGAYDFGEFTGITIVGVSYEARGYYIAYDATDVQAYGRYAAEHLVDLCISRYCDALKKNGFEYKGYDREASGTVYESDTERVIVGKDEKNDYIIVIVEMIAQYYLEIPELPDAGWYLDIDMINVTRDGEGFVYTYDIAEKMGNTADNVTEFAIDYASYIYLLIDEGFESHAQEISEDEETLTYVLIGNGYVVECILTEEEMTVKATPATAVPSSDSFEKLRAYLIENGQYSEEDSRYRLHSYNGADRYDVTYYTDTGVICFGLFKNDSTSVKDGCIFLYYDGQASARYSYETKVGGQTKSTELYANITPEEFSSSTELTPSYYTCSYSERDDYCAQTLERTLAAIRYCDRYILPQTGVSAADLGFTNIYN